MYVPHIASAMLDTRDSVYFNVEGTMIYDPSINSNAVMTEIPAVAFLDNWKHLFSLNDTHMDYLHRQNEKCGYKAFLDKYLVYPPKGRLPSPPSLNSIPGGCDLYTDIQTAAALVNPVSPRSPNPSSDPRAR
jgi:carboxypeptidase D